jgi:hypothetical protein
MLALLVGAVPAAAQKSPDPATRAEAERFFRAGESAYNAGQYAPAGQAFEEAYRLLPLPAIAFSTAQAHRLQYFIDKDPSRLKRAIELYRVYVERAPTGGRRDDAATSLGELEPILGRLEEEQARRGMGPIASQPAAQTVTQLMISTQVAEAKVALDGTEPAPVPVIREVEPGPHKVEVAAPGYFPARQNATAVEGRLVVIEVELAPMPALVGLRVERGAAISVDGRPVGESPLARALELDAGPHLLTVLRRGRHAWSREIDLERGQELDLDVDLATTTQRKIALWTWGASAATLGGAALYGFLAFRSDGDASDLLTKRKTQALSQDELAQYRNLVDQRDDRATRATTLLGLGGALAVTGTLLFFLDTPTAHAAPPRMQKAPAAPAVPPTPTAVVPIVAPDRAGVGVAGRF